jgi:undecaprenyl-diphosphatase
MPIVHAIVLGLTQGLSEFLPISSSGHLLVVPWLFGWDDFKSNAALEKSFDVALHIGTLVAVVVYFRHDLVVYVRAGLRTIFHRREPMTHEGKIAWLLLLSTIPGVIVGGLGQSFIDDHLGQIPLIAVMLIVFGVVLYIADRQRGARVIDSFSARDAIVIGLVQACALQPGVSRSGSTMTAGRFLGFSREGAARVSFLMAVPITAGAVLYKATKQLKDGVPGGLWWPLAVGVLASAASGFLAVAGLLRLVRTRSFTPFVIYRVLAGAAILTVAATGLR